MGNFLSIYIFDAFEPTVSRINHSAYKFLSKKDCKKPFTVINTDKKFRTLCNIIERHTNMLRKRTRLGSSSNSNSNSIKLAQLCASHLIRNIKK